MLRVTKKKSLAFVVAAALSVLGAGGIVGTGSSYAATCVGTTCLIGSQTDATAIDGLVVFNGPGGTYNVTFEPGSYSTVFATTQPAFLNDYVGVVSASSALAGALSALGVTGLSGNPYPSSENALIPFQFYAATSSSAAYTVVWENDEDATAVWNYDLVYNIPAAAVGSENNACCARFDYAVFTVATTPLPAALPLFAAGLGAMGLLGWRRKRKAAAVAV